MNKIRVAVIGAGVFGRHHLRVLSQSLNATLVGVVDADPERAAQAAAEHNCLTFATLGELKGNVDAAVVAVPTSLHAEVGCELLESGIDVLVEKPIAADLASARRLVDTAAEHERILQIGHLERFNPAVAALKKITTIPLFFEIHRLSLFSPRSLDVDVVLDLMIHDLDIVLDLAGAMPEEIRAAGISILSDKVDIANVRLAFPGRMHRQSDRQPRFHRTRPQTAALPAASVHFARLPEAGGRGVHGERKPADRISAAARRSRKSRCGWRWSRFWMLWPIARAHWCPGKRDCGRSKSRWRFLIKLKSTRSWSRNGSNHLASNYLATVGARSTSFIRPS